MSTLTTNNSITISRVEEIINLNNKHPDKFKLIRNNKLGQVLSDLAKKEQDRAAANKILNLSYRLITDLTKHFFYTKDLRALADKSFQKTTLDNPPLENKIKSTLNSLSHTSRGATTLTIALDDLNGRLSIAQSGRVFNPANVKTLLWEQAKDDWKKAFPHQELSFPPLYEKRFTLSLMIQALYNNTYFLEDPTKLSAYLNANQVKGKFIWKLYRLMETNPQIEKRAQIISSMKLYFPRIIDDYQWQKLEELIKKPTIGYHDITSILLDKFSTRKQLLTMGTLNLTCGEMKIALSYLREFGSLPAQEKEARGLPLGSQLYFASFLENNTGNTEVKRISSCERCSQTWPILEALHFALWASGLDLAAIENLDPQDFPLDFLEDK